MKWLRVRAAVFLMIYSLMLQGCFALAAGAVGGAAGGATLGTPGMVAGHVVGHVAGKKLDEENKK